MLIWVQKEGETLKDRLKELRNALNKTQQQFADQLKISRNNVACYETGKNTPSDAVVSLICKEFNVNEEWIRHGTGEMFQTMTRREQISQFAGSLMKEEDESFKVRLFEILAQLDESEWEVLEGIAKKAIKKD